MGDFVQLPVVQALAWALVHFVWQGAAIGLAAFVALRTARTATARYAIGVTALALMLAAPVVTFLILSNAPATAASQHRPSAAPDTPAQRPSATHESTPDAAVVPAPAPIRVSPDLLAIAVMSWLGGVAFFSTRLFGGWLVARAAARRTVKPAADRVQDVARALADRLGVRRAVRILQSTTIAVPVMVGWLKPAIVLPVAALASLTPSQLESLIAHELAHVRRHDYLVNVLQSVVEAVLFYHPAVWWLSRQVRAERELCCDDLAVGVCDRLVYATALTDLASLATPRLALAATDGHLLNRVRRILGQTDERIAMRAGLMPVLALALAAAVAVPAVLASGAPPVAQPQDQVQLTGQVSAVVDQTGVAVTAERASTDVGFAEMQQTLDQTARQQQIEELRRRIEELQKQLASVEQRRGTERGAEADAQRQKEQKEIEALVEAQQKAAMARQQDVQKLIEKMTQGGTINEDQLRTLRGWQRDLAKMQADGTLMAAQSETARRSYEDAMRQFDKGLISEQQLKEIEAAMKRAEAAGNPQLLATVNMAEAQRQLERAKALQDKGLISAAQVADMERALSKLQAGGDVLARQAIDMEEARAKLERANELAQKGLTPQRDVERAKSDVAALEQRMTDRRMEVTPERMARAYNLPETIAPAADQSRAVQRGDILRITIQGEPDLPFTYEVREDGTIRLPLLAATKAAGLTAADVRTAIGKQLADRKLGSADRVTVTLMSRK